MIPTAVLIALATLVTSSPQERGWSILLLIDVTASVSDAMATVEGAPVPLPRPDGTGPYEIAPRPRAVKRPNSPRDLFLEPVVEGVIRRLGPQDRLRIGRVARTTTLSPTFSGDPTELVRVTQWALDIDEGGRYGPTPLWDAVDTGVSALEFEGGRRALILVTDGMSTGNHLPLDAAIAHAVRAQVIVSVLGETWGQRPRVAFRRTSGWAASDDTGSLWRVVRWPFGNVPDTNLRKLAISTGGIFAADGDAARDPAPRAAFARILDHLQQIQ